MNKNLINVVVFLLVSIMAVSCSSQKVDIPEEIKEPEPTETPFPTNTPEPTQTPEPTLFPTSTPNPDFVGCYEQEYAIDTDMAQLSTLVMSAKSNGGKWEIFDSKDNLIISIEKLEKNNSENNQILINKNGVVETSVGMPIFITYWTADEISDYKSSQGTTPPINVGVFFSPDIFNFIVPAHGNEGLYHWEFRNLVIADGIIAPIKFFYEINDEWCFSDMQKYTEENCVIIKITDKSRKQYASYWGEDIRGNVTCPKISIEIKPPEEKY